MVSSLSDVKAPDIVWSLPFLAIAGIFSGIYEGVFILESVLFPLVGILLPVLVQEKSRLSLAGKSGFIVLGVLIFLSLVSVPPVLMLSSIIAVSIYYLSGDRFKPVVAGVLAQLMDGVSTIVVLAEGGTEKMLIPAYAIEVMGSGGIMVVKAAVLIPYVAYSFSTEDNWLDYFVYAAGVILLFHNMALWNEAFAVSAFSVHESLAVTFSFFVSIIKDVDVIV